MSDIKVTILQSFFYLLNFLYAEKNIACYLFVIISFLTVQSASNNHGICLSMEEKQIEDLRNIIKEHELSSIRSKILNLFS